MIDPITEQVEELPVSPSRTAGGGFAGRADTFLSALEPMREQIMGVVGGLNRVVGEINQMIAIPSVNYLPAATREEVLDGELGDVVVTPAGLAIAGLVRGDNLLLNGNFDVWQRATSQTSNGYGSDDRWSNPSSGSTKTHTRQAFALGDTNSWDAPARYFSRTVVTSVAGASNLVSKIQNIEDVTRTAGRTGWLTFRAKADASRSMSVEFSQWFGSGGSPSAAVTGIAAQKVQLTTAWQKFSLPVSLPSIAGKTLGTDGAHTSSLCLAFWFDAGTTYDARTASLGQQSGTFDIAQVKFELGEVATPFVCRSLEDELRACQRYYEIVHGVTFTSLATGIPSFPCRVPKRASPSIGTPSFGSGGTGGAFTVLAYDHTAGVYQSAPHSVISAFKLPLDSEL